MTKNKDQLADELREAKSDVYHAIGSEETPEAVRDDLIGLPGKIDEVAEALEDFSAYIDDPSELHR